MQLVTEILGEISFEETEIIDFAEGIYGFEGLKRFLVINVDEGNLPFQWLQSVDNGNLSFILTTPFAFYEPYDFEISDTIVEQLDIVSSDDLVIYSLVVLKDQMEESTINLKAPILINIRNRRGKQIILNEDYPYKYPFFKQHRQEG